MKRLAVNIPPELEARLLGAQRDFASSAKMVPTLSQFVRLLLDSALEARHSHAKRT
jgi:hypothetical protein